MNRSVLGILAASAVASLLGSAALAADNGTGAGAGDAKACYRTHCGKSVTGHKGSCGGSKVKDISDEKTCTDAGGAWTTAADAKQYEKNDKD